MQCNVKQYVYIYTDIHIYYNYSMFSVILALYINYLIQSLHVSVLRSVSCYHPHFTNEEINAQRGSETCRRSEPPHRMAILQQGRGKSLAMRLERRDEMVLGGVVHVL